MNRHFYLNDDHSVTPCDVGKWSEQFEEMSRNNTKHVVDDLVNGKRVSTVWLGTNYRYGDDVPPQIFETMVFAEGSFQELYCDRYATWDEALAGHKKAIQWVLEGCKDEMV